MKKNSRAVCHYLSFCMSSSGLFTPSGVDFNCASGYSMPEKFAVTSSSMLWRVRKAGKFFIIKTPKDNSTQSIAMLQREYELSIGRSHPNVVNIFTYEPSTVVGPGIVMEYVDGCTLDEFLASNPSLEIRRRVFEQLVAAVAYIHRSGIVHNDIKPGNILVTRADNDVKLIDFGLADNDAHYLARTLGCTPEYASPELLLQSKDIDARSDIYSLGVIMKEIFGKRYARISARCLRTQKEKRYANADELLKSFSRRNRPAKVMAAVVLFVLFFISVLYVGQVSIENEQRIVEQQVKTEQKSSERDAVIERVVADIEALYVVTADSVACAPYFEFATNHIVNFYEAAGAYQTANISPIVDPELSTVVLAQYQQTLNKCQEQLWERASSLPLLSNGNLSPEEVVFYDSLVSCRLPFTPYK